VFLVFFVASTFFFVWFLVFLPFDELEDFTEGLDNWTKDGFEVEDGIIDEYDDGIVEGSIDIDGSIEGIVVVVVGKSEGKELW